MQTIRCSVLFSVPAILNEAVPATTQNVDTEIQATLRCADKYTGNTKLNKFSYSLLKQTLIFIFFFWTDTYANLSWRIL